MAGSDQQQSEVHQTYRGIITDTIPGSWRDWARAVIGAYAGFSVVMDLLFWVHRYAFDLGEVGDPITGIPTWKLAVDTVFWIGVLYWLYHGGLLNDQ